MSPADTYQVRLRSSKQAPVSFDCPPKMSVLRAAKIAGIELSAGCMQGRCYTCRTLLVEGTVANSRSLSRNATVDPADLGEGKILLCSVTPTSDLIVEPEGPWDITAR